MTPTSPQKLGRYEVLEEIGKGAMGVVYLARDPLIGRLVALKTFRVGFSAKDQELAQFRSRFVREAQSAGILSHPNIVTIHDVVDEGADGVCFIAMEYVKGTNLKQLLQKPDTFSTEFLVEVVSQVAEALDYAHSRGVVHRDIKPANILITPENKVKITDFGIARLDTSNLTMEGQLLGTPNYMAPEQIQGKDVDHRADIFSLGVVFYEMLTRRKPFAGENLTAVTHKIVFEPFTPAQEIVKDLPPGLTSILDRCLEKDPNRRFPRAAEIAKELRRRLESGQDLDDTSATQEVEPVEAPTRRISRAEILAAAVPPESLAAPVPEPVSPALERLPAPPPAPAPAAERAVGEATVDARLGAPSQGSAPPSTTRRKWLLPAVVGIAVLGFLGIIGLWMVGDGSQSAPVAPALSPEQQSRLTAATALAEGRSLLAQGNLQGALQAVARAELADPANPDAAEIRRQIDLRSRELAAAAEVDRRVAEGMIAAREAYSRRRYEDALTALRGVLELRPEEPEAVKLIADSESAIEQQRQRQRAARAVTPTPPAPAAPTRSIPAASAPVEPQTAQVPADTTLVVDFFSDSSEGILTIYAGERQIVRESFKFVRKTGFLRSEKISGELEARRTLQPGPTTLRVYVSMPGRATKAVVVEGELRPGAEQLLEIRVDDEGATTAILR